MAADLEPCPFCGALADWNAGMGWFSVECTGCHVETEAYADADDAIAAWNRRASPSSSVLERAAPREPLPAETAQPMFASHVGRRKWESLQGDGYRMQRIHFARSVGGVERRGSIDPWGKVLWESALSQSTEQGERDAAPFDRDYVYGYLSQVLGEAVGPTKDPHIKALMAWLIQPGAAMSPHGDGVNYTRAEGGEDGASRLRFDVLQEIAQTFGLDYNAVCRCANAYLAGVSLPRQEVSGQNHQGVDASGFGEGVGRG